MNEHTIDTLGALLLLVCLIGCCLSGLAVCGSRSDANEQILACSQACGQRGMASWSYADGCVCGGQSTEEP